MSAYETDYHAWAMEQAQALKQRSANEIDWDNVAEELEDLGKSQVKELRSRLTVLLLHLLKWAYQPDKQGRSWYATIMTQRHAIADHLAENPSLKSREVAEFARAYRDARLEASGETDLPIELFPLDPPFSLAEAKAEDWWPEPARGEKA